MIFINDKYRSIIFNSIFIILIASPIFNVIGLLLHLSGIVVLSDIFIFVVALLLYALYQYVNEKISKAKNSKNKFIIAQPTEGDPKVLFRDEHQLGAAKSSSALVYEIAECTHLDYDLATGLVNPDVKKSGKFAILRPGDYLPLQKNSNLLDLLGYFTQNSDPKMFEVHNDPSKLEFQQRLLYSKIQGLERESFYLEDAKQQEQTKRFDIERKSLEGAGQLASPWTKILNMVNDTMGTFSGHSEDMKMLAIKQKSGNINKKELQRNVLEKIKKEATKQLDELSGSKK